MKRKVVLSIAGSDCSGGAGIQADLKTMLANGVYGMTAVTALTAQNTMGVSSVMAVTPEFLEAELRAVFDDIYPDAVKIGMLCSEELAAVTAEVLRREKAANIVIDPVMVSTSGRELLDERAVERMTQELFPLAELITPNIPEAEKLLGSPIGDGADRTERERAAQVLAQRFGCSVLIKGGHSTDGKGADDYLYLRQRGNGVSRNSGVWIEGERIDNPNSHGTGCTLSSAIAGNLAKGFDLEESVRRAKAYLSQALAAGLDLGKGNGPLDHGCCFNVEARRECLSGKV